MSASAFSQVSGSSSLPVSSNLVRAYCVKSFGAMTSSSVCFALRQNGSFSSLKIRRIMCRLLPR